METMAKLIQIRLAAIEAGAPEDLPPIEVGGRPLGAMGATCSSRGPSLAEVEGLQGTRVLFVVAEVERYVLVYFVRVYPEPYTAKLTPTRANL